MKISVIIPTKNRSKLLSNTLNSILNQTLNKNDFEVIVVDNASIDNTKEVVQSYFGKLNIIYQYEPKVGLHSGRHLGLSLSRSNNLVFIDDDIEAFPKWLETICSIFEKDDNIAMVGGKNLPKFETIPPFWILEMWNNTIEFGHILSDLSILDFGSDEKTISPHYIFGCNFSIRKNVLKAAGGFHPDGMPFELIKFRGDGESHVSQYVLENGLKAIYHPDASVYHWVSKERMTHEYFCHRRYIQGISDAYTNLRNKKVETNLKSNLYNKTKHFLKIFVGIEHLRILNQIILILNKSDFDKRLSQSYNNGYNYLYKCYKNEIEIMNWIHKENYY